MKIAIIDDGIGAFAALNKLKYSLLADYSVHILDKHFPLGELNRSQLFGIAQQVLKNALEVQQCDAVVFSSIALSMASVKSLANEHTPLFGCEAPILHASTYTASQVLVVGDSYVAQCAKRFPNVIPLSLPKFSYLAESGADEREIVSYIAENAEKFSGSFDCIALGNSSMNLYKTCFSRVFPNAQIFDSLEGIARKLRKKFKKNNRDESTVEVFGESGENLMQKYNIFIDEFSSAY